MTDLVMVNLALVLFGAVMAAIGIALLITPERGLGHQPPPGRRPPLPRCGSIRPAARKARS